MAAYEMALKAAGVKYSMFKYPGTAHGFNNDTTPRYDEAAAKLAWFVALTTIEGQFLNPMIVGHRLTLNPVMVFVSLLLWGWIWGVLGVVLAVPILVTLKVVCDHVAGLGAVGEFLGEKRRR